MCKALALSQLTSTILATASLVTLSLFTLDKAPIIVTVVAPNLVAHDTTVMPTNLAVDNTTRAGIRLRLLIPLVMVRWLLALEDGELEGCDSWRIAGDIVPLDLLLVCEYVRVPARGGDVSGGHIRAQPLSIVLGEGDLIAIHRAGECLFGT